MGGVSEEGAGMRKCWRRLGYGFLAVARLLSRPCRFDSEQDGT